MTWNGINWPRPEPKPNPNIELAISEFDNAIWVCRLCGEGSRLGSTHIVHKIDCEEFKRQETLLLP